ncbi:unnamed protein product [Mytilus edulis]|uniref:C-type lectin domain-containing protein n=1 Tax=Mytilus edulis TaxID=6550 RepID=A0A8S3USA2_MYTED|nr:unnamed protein product [Mytilus edulis]
MPVTRTLVMSVTLTLMLSVTLTLMIDVCNPNPNDVCNPNTYDVYNPKPSDVCNPYPNDVCNPNPNDVFNTNPNDVCYPNPNDVCNPTLSDACNPGPNDICNLNPNDVCNPNTYDVYNPKPSDVCNPYPYDLCNPNPNDVCNDNSNDVCHTNTNDIYFVLLIVIFLSSNTCYAQVILEGDTQAFFEDGGGTGTDFSLVSALLPLLLLGPLLLAATTPTATAAQAVQVPVMVAPVPVAPTQCVSETCPTGFMVLPNQASSTSCYSDSGATTQTWNAALTDCTSTPGAYLWRPNTEQEAAAVRNKYTIPLATIWTGANDVDKDMTFTFAIENSQLNFFGPPFGINTINSAAGSDCVTLFFGRTSWVWSDQLCTRTYRYICEYPRRVCP